MHVTTTVNPHHQMLEQQLPKWARHIRTEQWQALQQSLGAAQSLNALDWFANAAPDLREAVTASQARLWRAQTALARSLQGLRQITEFTQPLLEAHLAQQGFEAPLHDARLLRVERTWVWLGLRFLYNHRLDTLLQAALQNFADDETFTAQSAIALSGDIVITPERVEGTVLASPDLPSPSLWLASERYQVKPLALTPQAFAEHCRTLDLGARYQQHLAHSFACAPVREQSIAVLRGQLQLAANLAYLRHHLTGAGLDILTTLLNGAPVRCWTLSLFGIALHEVTLIDAGKAGLLLHLPGDDAALRQCLDLDGVHQALLTLLLEPASRQAFMRYLAHDQHAHFLDLLQQNLDAAGNSAADLRPSREAITGELFGALHERHVQRLKDAARSLAVPTGQADEQARKRRLEQWQDLGLDAANLAAFFVPGVGTLMLAVTACQLLEEIFEGYAAWQQGDRHLALQHLEAVGLNLALVAGLAGAAHAVPRLLNSPLMERLEEIRLGNGQYRLWQPDLAPYRSDITLPEALQPNRQGQYLHAGRYFVRLDEHLYEQHLDTSRGQWQIKHPTDAQAWQPPLQHNGEGAWHAPHERPQYWDYTRLARRLGADYRAFSSAELALAADISGIDAAQLRQVYLAGQPTPLLLLDTLQRMAARAEALAMRDVEPAALFETLYQGDSAPQAGAQRLLTAYPRLSSPLAERLLSPLGSTDLQAWEQTGELPAWLRLRIEQVHSDLPLVRASEALLLPLQPSSDGEHLLFNALPALQDWPVELRLELRAASPTGALLAGCGSPEATTVCRVLKSAEGYEADLGERPVAALSDPDLCRAVAQALPAAVRQALALSVNPGAQLRRRLTSWLAKNRAAVAQRLWGDPKRALRSKARLRGGSPLDPTPSIPHAWSNLHHRYRALYPAVDNEEIALVFARWERNLASPSLELRALEQRLSALQQSLRSWAGSVVQRQRAINPIVNAWRRNSSVYVADVGTLQGLDLSGLELQDQDLAALSLPDDFTHVHHLNLQCNRALSQLPDTFLRRLPGLRLLYLNECRFDRLPAPVNPDALYWLDLDDNRITWDDQAQADLQRLRNLKYLFLSRNPLLRTPDLRSLATLQTLFMSDCSLTELPQGLELIEQPFVLDLSDNQFTHLPLGFALPQATGQVLRLESEWLGPTMLFDVDDYYRRHEVDLLVDESDYDSFFEGTGPDQQMLWQQLPVQYRRDLRVLAESFEFMTDPQWARDEFWLRIARVCRDQTFRLRAFTRPPGELLDIPL
ncbi:dermonecrotic toxin domain-containing protein [Pseudomonas putida]